MHRSRPARSPRTYLLAVTLPALAAILVASATAFAADTGSATPRTSTSAGVTLLTLSDGTQLPQGIETLRHTKAVDGAGRISALRRPSWSPSAGEIGAVEQAGDLFLVDARHATGPVDVTLHIANLGSLADAYTSLLLPVAVWRATSSGAWAAASGEPLYLTHTTGSLEIRLAPGAVYDLTLETGGTWAAAPTTAVEYAPQFYATIR